MKFIYNSDKKDLVKVWNYLKTKSGKYIIEVKKCYENRTLPQNKLYWVALGLFAETVGSSADDMHEYCKMKYNPKEVKVGDDIVVIPGSTRDMSKDDFRIYLNKIIDEMNNEHGIIFNPENTDPDYWVQLENSYKRYESFMREHEHNLID